VLALNPTTVNFATWGNAALPGMQEIQVANAFSSTPITGLTWTVSFSGLTGWIDPIGVGSSTPAKLLLQPYTTNLTAGVYTAVLRVFGNGVSPVPANLTYVVQTFTNEIYPILNGCSPGCHGAVGPTVTNTSNTPANVYAGVRSYAGNGKLACKLLAPRNDPACAHGSNNLATKFSAGSLPYILLQSWLGSAYPFK
jgi:hypothetical protein